MKPRRAAALALLLLASCAPNMASIDQSTKRAEAAADRADRSATQAEQAADQALDASVRAEKSTEGMQAIVQRAESAANECIAAYLARTPHPRRVFRWYLMRPPARRTGSNDWKLDISAPLFHWIVDGALETRTQCYGVLQEMHDSGNHLLAGADPNTLAGQVFLATRCIARNDPRLKEPPK